MFAQDENAAAARTHAPGFEQRGAGSTDPAPHAFGAQCLGQCFAVAQPVLQADGDAVRRQASGKLARRSFCLPGFDQHQGVARRAAFLRRGSYLHRVAVLMPIGFHQPHAVLAQRLQARLPGAQHGDRVPGGCQAGGKQACHGACANNKNGWKVFVLARIILGRGVGNRVYRIVWRGGAGASRPYGL